MTQKKIEFESEHRELIVLREKNIPAGNKPAYVIPELLDLAQNLYFEKIKLTVAKKDPHTDSAFMRHVLRAEKEGLITAEEVIRLKDDYDALSNSITGMLPFESAHQAQMYYLHLCNRMAEASIPPPMPQSQKHLARSMVDADWKKTWEVCNEENETDFSPSMKSKYPKDRNYVLVAFKWLFALAIGVGTAATIFFSLGTALLPAVLTTAAIGLVVFLEKFIGNESRLTMMARNISRTFSGLYHHTREWSLKDTVFTLGLATAVGLMLWATAHGLMLKSVQTLGLLGGGLFAVGSMVHNSSSLLDGARKLLEKWFGHSFQFGFRSLTLDAQLHTKDLTTSFHLVYGAQAEGKEAEAEPAPIISNMRILAPEMTVYLQRNLSNKPSVQPPASSFEKENAADSDMSDVPKISELFSENFKNAAGICYQFEQNGRLHPVSLNTWKSEMSGVQSVMPAKRF